MQKYRIIFALLIALLSCQTTSAQVNDQNEMINRRTAEKVAQLNDYISFMASSKKNLENRKYYKPKALNLFVGKGYSYEENGVVKEGVMVEIISPTGKRSTQLLRNFFDALVSLRYDYRDIRIISVERVNKNNDETGEVYETMLGNISVEIKRRK